MTGCGCRKGAIRLDCERHDPGNALTSDGRLMAIWWRVTRKIVAWHKATS